MNRLRRHVPLLVLTLSTLACGGGRDDEAGSSAAGDTGHTGDAVAARAGPAIDAPAGVIDSLVPSDVALARFRDDLAEPGRLTSGAASRDALVAAVVEAVSAGDTLALEALAPTRAEWAWLYFPTSVIARPPYELPPALAWFQLQGTNRRAVLRALARLGGRRLDLAGHACDPGPVVEGENRLWIGCMVELSVDGDEPAPIRLFSTLLERDGRFAVLSWANDF